MTSLDIFLKDQLVRVAKAPWWEPVQTFARRDQPNPRALPELPSGAPWHGTYSGYTTHRCRCIECRRANTDHKRMLKARAAAKAQSQIPEKTMRCFHERVR